MDLNPNHSEPGKLQRRISYDFHSDAEIEAFQNTRQISFKPPPFTYTELKDAIPPHLFERSTLKSSVYLLANLFACTTLFYLATFIDDLPPFFKWVTWPTFWVLEGIALSGLWVIAHDCGHQAFSPIIPVNHIIGFILHTILLVPYHSWRISHLQHHSGRAHIDREPTFTPRRRSQVQIPHTHTQSHEQEHDHAQSRWKDALEDSPLPTLIKLIAYILIGWPAYLLMNASGQNYDRFTSHFIPSSPIFKSSHRNQVLISDAGLVVFLCILVYFSYLTSFTSLVKFYIVPYLIVNGFLVCVTLLQHTDVFLPIYADESWTFVRGALATVDRDYGWFLNTAFHHINDSHVVHHLFAQIPHYNAIIATKYLKAKLGDYYIEDKTPPLRALWRVLKNCVVVENSGDILFYSRK